MLNKSILPKINRSRKNPGFSSEHSHESVSQDGGLQGVAVPPLGRRQKPLSKPACRPALQEWIDCADDLFHGKGGFYGFIVTKDNLHSDSYGYDRLYEKVKRRVDYEKINTIKELKGRKKRLYAYELGLIRENEVYEWFADLVNRQNNTGARLISPEGKEIIAQNGRFCNKRGKRSIHIQKVFKEGIGEISDCILLTLTTHENEVRSVMPENTNLKPVQFATMEVGKWISYFLRRLRQYQKNRGIAWEFVGWTLEFQEGEEKGPEGHHGDHLKMHNGFPHVHMIFKGKWIGSIEEIASLWPYCEAQGVDYMNKAKYERKLRAEGKLKPWEHVSGIHLINYVTSYVSKCSKAVIMREKDIYGHKGYAWLAYSGGRMFNVAREYKREKNPDLQKDDKGGWEYGGVQVYQGEKSKL